MSKDFAKKPKKSAPKAKPKNQVPGWVWLFTGAILGGFIMFLAHLSGISPNTSTGTTGNPVAKVEPKPEKTIPKPRFDFYKLLKESEVPVPDVDTSTNTTTTPVDQLEYILQVGSFKRSGEADRLRAELILMNLDTQIEKVTVRNGETWHRVLVGPFQSRSKLAQARSTLVSNDINPLLLKRKAG